MARHKGGDKFDGLRKTMYLKELENGRSPRAAAQAVGVTTQTVNNHKRMDPEFAEACTLAEIDGLQPIEDRAYEVALEGSETMLKFILTNRMPKRWRDIRSVNQQIDVHHQVELEAGDRLSRILELSERLNQRKELRAADDIEEAEIVEPEAD